MIRKRLTAVLAAMIVALGGVVAGAMPAQAAGKEVDYAVVHEWTTTDKDCVDLTYVSACVQPYGDLLWLKDRRKDGNGVVLSWTVINGTRFGACENNKGVDNGWTRCNKDFPEGTPLSWSVGYTNGAGDWVSKGGYGTWV